MEKILKKLYIFLIVATIISGCRSFVSFNGETYTPEKESLALINESICVYTHYDIIQNKEYIDSCNWSYDSRKRNVVIRNLSFLKDSSLISNDSIRKKRLNFLYDICPKWYNLTDEDFKSYIDYKYPLYQENMSIPYTPPTFYQKYGLKITCDTALLMGERFLAVRKSKFYSPPMFFTPSFFQTNITYMRTKIKKNKLRSRFERRSDKQIDPWITNSYEYINYKVNYERKVHFDLDSIIGKQFSYIGDMLEKESLQFINDSVCVHTFSVRADMYTSYVSSILDTCRFSFKNNLIGIEFVKGKSCDTLTYSNGILFYSKVYRNDDNGEYSHIVKPFIDETRSCANKTDSINMIMSTYFSTYVPLNLY